jgi:3-oxoacyl-[acyl-carrier protein] reductase
MELGLAGKVALVCASSRGLGKACATALAREGCQVYINGRNAQVLAATAEEIERLTGHRPVVVEADLNTEAGRNTLFTACPEADILINNNGGPSPGRIKDWSVADWQAAFESNLLSPAMMIKHYIPGMRARKFGRIINITSAMVKSPSIRMGLSAAMRAGLTALSKSVQRESVPDNVTINNLLPERIDTDRQVFMAEKMMREEGITREQARAKIAATIAAGRLGEPHEFADACVFLCAAQSGYISGQNLQLDGGSYEGLV